MNQHSTYIKAHPTIQFSQNAQNNTPKHQVHPPSSPPPATSLHALPWWHAIFPTVSTHERFERARLSAGLANSGLKHLVCVDVKKPDEVLSVISMRWRKTGSETEMESGMTPVPDCRHDASKFVFDKEGAMRRDAMRICGVDEYIKLESLCTHTKVRGRGVASFVMRECKKAAGGVSLYGQCEAERMPFYQRLGGKPVGMVHWDFRPWVERGIVSNVLVWFDLSKV